MLYHILKHYYSVSFDDTHSLFCACKSLIVQIISSPSVKFLFAPHIFSVHSNPFIPHSVRLICTRYSCTRTRMWKRACICIKCAVFYLLTCVQTHGFAVVFSHAYKLVVPRLTTPFYSVFFIRTPWTGLTLIETFLLIKPQSLPSALLRLRVKLVTIVYQCLTRCLWAPLPWLSKKLQSKLMSSDNKGLIRSSHSRLWIWRPGFKSQHDFCFVQWYPWLVESLYNYDSQTS